MSFEHLSTADKTKLTEFMDAGIKTLQEIDDLKGSLKDLASELAEHLDVKPSLLMKTLRHAYKANIHEEVEKVQAVETILEATGRL
jgi:hypothetical protein